MDYMKLQVLEKLPQAKGAAFNSYADENEPKCHPATRIDLLQDIYHWVDEPDGKNIFWLYGAAGTGKSTISRTVAEFLQAKGVLSASFFFKKGEGDRGNASRFFTTISWQLANNIPDLIPYIAKALETDAGIIDKAAETQYEELILNPLSAIQWTSPTKLRQAVVIIDALDECDEDQQRMRKILNLLSRVKGVNGIDLRIFVTSRPELPIRLGFKQIDSDTHKNVALHDIPEPVVDHDLRIVLTSELEYIRQEHSIPSPWPTKDNIDALVQIARPLFIHAATVCRFISHRFLGTPQELLQNVLESAGNTPTSDLSETYKPVLRQLVIKCPKLHQGIVLQKFRLIIGTIIILFDPLPKLAIAVLLNLLTPQLDGILDYLHSVLKVPSKEELPIQLFHLSFHDFLVNRNQCDPDFWIDEEAAHGIIATRCIEVMSAKGGLRENICGLEYPGKLRSEISINSVNTCVPAELRYACHHWVDHLRRSGRHIHDSDEIDNFLRKHFLHLLEVLGILGRSSESISMIAILQSLLEVRLAYYVTSLHFLTISRANIAHNVVSFSKMLSASY
jgi:hypothetical protein